MASNAPDDRLLTIEELSHYLGLAVGTIRNRVSRDEIPYVKLGHAVRFRRSEIDAWMESHRSENGTPTEKSA